MTALQRRALATPMATADGALDRALIERRGRLAIGLSIKRNKPIFRASPFLPIEGRFKDCAEPEIVFMRDRVVPVIVALGAREGDSHQRRRDNVDGIGDRLVPRHLHVIDRAAGSVGGHPQKTGRCQ
jgi:hypothetical protein